MAFHLPLAELDVRTSRAGGPGGQHVNRSSTKVEVRWNVRETSVLSETQRTRVLERLATRIGKDGVLRVVAGQRRSQAQNRQAAISRLEGLVREALQVPKPRHKTRPPKSAIEGRLEVKRQRGKQKRDRRPPLEDD